MRIKSLAGIALIVTSLSCTSRDIPEFNSINYTRTEQEITSCYEDSSLAFKLEAAESILYESVCYGIKYNKRISRKDFSDCEQELLYMLLQEKSKQPELKGFPYYEREDEAWNLLLKEARTKMFYNQNNPKAD